MNRTNNFTNGKPWTVTKDDCKLPWGGGKNGKYFRCYLCGYKFVYGDVARWQFTNDVPGAGDNPFVCQKCDGTKDEIVAKWKKMAEEFGTRFWWFAKED